MPIVSQMFSQSGSNCSLRKRIARGAVVVPDVSFSSEGRWPCQSIGSAATIGLSSRAEARDPADGTLKITHADPSTVARDDMLASAGTLQSRKSLFVYS